MWIWNHWQELMMGSGLVGGTLGLPKLIPRIWRSFVSFIAAKILLDIEREKNKAREEQVADLLEELEWRRKQIEHQEHLP